jgi:PAS domain S-box-containing protein
MSTRRHISSPSAVSSTQKADSEALLGHLAGLIKDSFVLLEVGTGKVLYNNIDDQFLGHPISQFDEGGLSFLLNLVHPDEREQVHKGLVLQLQRLAQGHTLERELRFRRQDGSYAHLAVKEKAYEKDENGRVSQMSLLIRDISQLRQGEQKIEETNHLLESLTSTVPGLVYITDLVEDRIHFSNDAFSRQLGYSGEEWPLLKRSELIHPEDLERTTQELKDLEGPNQDAVVETEIRIRHKNGNWLWFSIRDRVYRRSADGTPHQIIGTATDITELKRSRDQAQQGRQIYRSIAKNIPNGFVVVFNRDLEFVLAEGPFLSRLGYVKKDIEGKCVKDHLPDGKTWKHLEGHFKKVLKGQVMKFEASENGLDFLIHLLPLKNKYGEIYAGMQITQDVTDLKRAQGELESRVEELAQTNRDLEKYIASNVELEQFAYIASHDLKEPIRTIISFSQLLQHRFKDHVEREAREYVDYIVEGGLRMQALIDGLLSYSRVDKDGKPFQLIEMDQVLFSVLQNINTQIENRGVQIIYEDLPMIKGDSIQVSQLLQNLISNGIKFNLNKSPEIHISHKKVGQEEIISVKDNGIGIEPENIDKIFGIFKRLHTREEFEGAGIGLAVCKRIMERHNGYIRVESELGKSTTFFLHFPRP